jgi:hypothetical protein
MEINTENNINNKSTEIVTNSQVLNERFVYKIYFFKFLIKINFVLINM